MSDARFEDLRHRYGAQVAPAAETETCALHGLPGPCAYYSLPEDDDDAEDED